jgi:LuxR family maltose regulon positive regulatory protein
MEQLLTTKLYIPQTRPAIVSRPRLIKRMNESLQSKLALVSAPAGFGKTTLVSEWVSGCNYPAAWLSLDEGDNHPPRFLTYLISALRTLDLSEFEGDSTNIGDGVLAMLQSPQPPPTESILTALLNEITTITEDFILALDDYHLIDSKPVDDALTFLLEHLPPQMHLVISTREDPNLPQARLRARGQLSEIRVADLRFTTAEAARFLNRVMGLNLSAEDIAALETRTEGWIAGLQLAAISMQGKIDTSSFIKSFTGSHRFVMDYLVEEVLKQQPEDVQTFLLSTSILDRLCGPLCDALLLAPPSTGQNTLKYLEHANLLLVPLDDQRQWYRYHHLFADVLQARLLDKQPNQVATLHLRASEWYQQNGSPPDAIHHALIAEDFERAASLIELAWPAMDSSFQTDTWLGWAQALPDDLVRKRPVLSVGYAWSLLNVGELEAGEIRLRDAERWLKVSGIGEGTKTTPSGMVVVDEEQFQTLPATIASARTYYSQALGDIPGSVKYAQQALDLLPADDYFGRGRMAVLLGLTYWSRGDLEAAYRSFTDAMASFQQVGNILFAISFTFILADISLAQGRLNEAINIYQRSLKLAKEQSEPPLQGTADIYLGLSEMYREKGDQEPARQYLLRCEDLDDQGEVHQYHLCRVRARIKQAQGEWGAALDLLDEAERWLHYQNPIPDVRPTAALKAQIWLEQGKPAKARAWAQEQGLSVDDELSYLREFEHATLARILIARYIKEMDERHIHAANGLLERLLRAAEEGSRKGSMLEILILQALAHQANDDIPSALMSLERALRLADPEGYVRIFVEEGKPMTQLLSAANSLGMMPDSTGKLLAAIDARAHLSEDESRSPPDQPLVEPLSERELEVLELIAQGLSNREICERLFLAMSTVKGHNRRIFGKLGVQRRTEAVARARELDLL